MYVIHLSDIMLLWKQLIFRYTGMYTNSIPQHNRIRKKVNTTTIKFKEALESLRAKLKQLNLT